MILSHIVAVDKHGVIGRAGTMPWHVDGELARFARLTMGRPVLMGRKTYRSLPKTLSGRQLIVLTRRPWRDERAIVVTSIDEAIVAAGHANELFIAGGGDVYSQTAALIDKLYLTAIDIAVSGDTYYDTDITREMRQVYYSERQTNYCYSYATYVRKS